MSETAAWICATCGVQYPPSGSPPQNCAICEDERQYVPESGQRWTTLHEMRDEGYRNTLQQLEPDVVGIRTEPQFAIGQQAILVRGTAGNVLWDCVSYIDDETVTAVREVGGISAIGISHPHFYASCVEWAKAFDASIYLPAADRAFVMRPDPTIRFFEEDVEPVAGARLVRVGGHFHGSTVLLWPEGADGRGILLTGDTVSVVADPGSVSIMYSYPNRIPLSAAEVRAVGDRVLRLEFDRLYGGWRGDVLRSDAKEAIRRSVDRYVGMLEGTWPRG